MDALRPVLDTALDAVVVMGRYGDVIAWNRVAERIFGWSGEEALGRPLADLIIPHRYRDAHQQGLERYLGSGEQRVLGRRIEIEALRRDGTEFPVELSITTAPSGAEEIFVGFLRDIGVRRDSEARLRRRTREAEMLFRLSAMAAESDSFDEALEACLRAICELADWPVGHAFLVPPSGQGALLPTSVWYEATPGVASPLKELTRQMRFEAGVGLPGLVLERGEPTWISDAELDPHFIRKGLGFGAAFAFPIKSEGRIIAVLEFFTFAKTEPDADLILTVRTLGEQVGRVLERKRTEEHQRLLVNELNHRVKNTLAIVQSLAAQTFRGEAAEASARRAFESRLAALAAAHDVLTGANWEAASLREVISKTGLGCGAGGGRLTVSGPDLDLPPRVAVALALALHELCTNAIKYGALSNETGTVSVGWEIRQADDAPRLHLLWEEQGGPPVRSPERRGFGSRMIERALAQELGGSAKLDFREAGLVCTIDALLPH